MVVVKITLLDEVKFSSQNLSKLLPCIWEVEGILKVDRRRAGGQNNK